MSICLCDAQSNFLLTIYKEKLKECTITLTEECPAGRCDRVMFISHILQVKPNGTFFSITVLTKVRRLAEI